MHPYEMQRNLHLRHTDELLGLKRGSVYHAINQLLRAQLIEPVEISRQGRWPERTVYRITPDGEDEMMFWLRDLLSTPVREPATFTAALAHMLQLQPSDALEQLQLRRVSLQAMIAAWRAVEVGVGTLVGRGSVIEVEYSRTLAEAELAWLGTLIDDLRAGRLQWDFDKIKQGIQNTDTHIENLPPTEESDA
jgi:DNA-binding PadR family transcriptional regulator